MSVLSLQVWLTPYLVLATPGLGQEHYTYVTAVRKVFAGYQCLLRGAFQLPGRGQDVLDFLDYNLKTHINWAGRSTVFLQGIRESWNRPEVFEASDVDHIRDQKIGELSALNTS
ncbi:uncharacterized protein FPRO_02898 [Fusarium proliferatum ET1]|uniref:Uncharacterized protein n=1 Tax=Fusarium proliferatum (strain ET1) TaxID=1227346 RepID=A0A1L7V9E4_FUSPR|nr:uncharacterized protein FPRO_02898 [Fusarium proliferatum ET1]CZR36842.1 uncharacterized protein FPRO_02898 [Fusarium proliferatum ET1]